MEHSTSWEAVSHLPSKEVSSFYENQSFVDMFIRACHWAYSKPGQSSSHAHALFL